MDTIMNEELIEKVSKSICMACDENPMHAGDCRGNDFRWQDYREPAIAAINSMENQPLTVAGYTADDLEGEPRAFTVYRNKSDADVESQHTGFPVKTLFME